MKKNLKIKIVIAMAILIVIGFFAGIACSFRENNKSLLIGSSELGTLDSEINSIISAYNPAESDDLTFKSYLERELNVGVTANDDETYSFSIDGYNYILSTVGIVRRNTIDGREDNIYSTVEEMMNDMNLEVGMLVKTEKYSEDLLDSGAFYDIVNSVDSPDNYTKIPLNNGLYATIHIENETINVKQIGAYGNGVTDDTEAINFALNLGYTNIDFPAGEYVISSDIILNKSGLSLIGHNSNIKGGTLIIQETENVSLYGLGLTAENNTTGLIVRNAKNITIYGGTFRNNGLSSMFDLEANSENVTIENNRIYSSSTGTSSLLKVQGNVSSGVKKLLFKDNSLQISDNGNVFDISSNTINIEDIRILNNTFNIDTPNNTISNFTFTNCKDLTIENNRITSTTKGLLIDVNNSQNTSITSNNINYHNKDLSNINNSVIKEDIDVLSNNTITINGDNENLVLSIFNIKGDMLNNNITISTPINFVVASANKVIGNTINLNQSANGIINNAKQIKNNIINIAGNIDYMFSYGDYSLNEDILIEGNVVNNNYDEATTNEGHIVLQIANTLMNGHTVLFTGNTINNANIGASDKAMILSFNPLDTNAEVRMENNIMPSYQGHNYFVKPGNRAIISNDEVKTYIVKFYDYDGTLLKEETVNEGTNAHAPAILDRTGYEFVGWDIDFNNVTENLIVTAQYKEMDLEPKDIIYSLIKGANQTYNIQTDDYLAFTIDCEPIKFRELYIDNKLVADNNYMVTGIETWITFKQEFSTKLSVGEHTIKFVFTDGYSETTFNVVMIPISNEEAKTDNQENVRIIDNGPQNVGTYRPYTYQRKENDKITIIEDNDTDTSNKDENKIEEKDKEKDKKTETDPKYTEEEEPEEEDERFTLSDNFIYYGSLALICIGLGLLIIVRIKRIKEL